MFGTSKSNNKRMEETPAENPDFSEKIKTLYKDQLFSISRGGMFDGRIRRDFSLDAEDESSSCTTILNYDKQAFLNFRKFDLVYDYSDHILGKYMNLEDSDPIHRLNSRAKRYVLEELKDDLEELKDDLSHTEGIFIRAYTPNLQLLRAVVVGAKGTPYQDGLYFFDV